MERRKISRKICNHINFCTIPPFLDYCAAVLKPRIMLIIEI